MVKVDHVIPGASVATQSQVPTIRTVQKIHKGSSTVAVLDLVVNVPVVDGVRISVSRHSDSKVQHIGKIVCVAGSEIDREASTTHSGMLTSSFKKKGLDQKTNHQNLMKTETEEIFV